MIGMSLPHPLGGPAPAEVPLPRAPLTRVLAQVRFPDILKINAQEGVADFQEQVRREYPLFNQDTTPQVNIEIIKGSPSLRSEARSIWRFADAEKNWRLSLSLGFVALEVEKYTSRNDFLSRLNSVMKIVEQVYDPGVALRAGIRYIDRISGPALAELERFIQPSLLGMFCGDLKSHVAQSISETSLQVEEGVAMVRVGVLPADSTYDPGLITPIGEQSWILDLDVASPEQRTFRSDELTDCFRSLSQRAYTLFRFAATKRLLEYYGGPNV